MREVISIHIGQAGVQMSSALWEQLCAEHNLNANGLLKGQLDQDNDGIDTFFCPSVSEQYVPRALGIDLEPTVLDEIRAGPYRKLFHPDMLLSGNEDASSNFARGHFTIGRTMIENAMSQIRKLVQTCEMLHGFIITTSFGGGTGSGFQTLMLERLSIEYAKHLKLSLVVFPSSALSTSTVEPYNTMLTNHFTMDISDLCVLFDNAAMYQLCTNSLSIDRPTYSNLNRVLAHVTSSLTVSMRYESSLNSDLDQIITNIVPFPRIHFPVLNAAPVISESKASHRVLSANEITRMVFENDNRLLSVDTLNGDYLCCSLQYRGNVTPRDANEAIFEVKKNQLINFVDWCPTGFKVGLNCHPPLSLAQSGIAETNIGLSMLANTSAIEAVFTEMCKNFDSLFQKRSFLHWFIGEGMEDGEFVESRDSMSHLITDYTGTHTEQELNVQNDEDQIGDIQFKEEDTVLNGSKDDLMKTTKKNSKGSKLSMASLDNKGMDKNVMQKVESYDNSGAKPETAGYSELPTVDKKQRL